MDTQLFYDINNFAKQTPWLHGFMANYANFVGLLLLILALVICLVRATIFDRSSERDRRIATILWTGVGAIVAFGINQPISHATGRPRPFVVLHGVEVLIAKASDPGLPSDHTTVAGAVIVGLWLTGDYLVASFATIVGLLLAFARVYVGAHYPGDVAAGLGLGAIVVGAGSFAAVGPLTTLVGWIRARVSSIE